MATMAINVDGVETALSIAMDQPGNLHLLVPIEAVSQPKPRDLNGLKVRYSRLETGFVLDLSAPPSHEQVFTPFCRDVINAIVVQCREPVAAVAAIVRSWQSAWKPVAQLMDKTTQVGLFGELFVLNTLMLPSLGSAAIDQWSGPDSERHDFSGEQLHVEVKTTRKSRPEHEISRLDQLWVPDGRRLLLASVQLEESVTGQETVASQLDATTEALRTDSAARDLFLAKMVNVGWSDEMRESGELLRFNLRDAFIYDVDMDFPRLPENISLPSGVVSVKYTIDLANLPALGFDEAISIIREAN